MAITAEQLDKVMPSAAELLSDEPEMESSLHSTQLMLLYETLDWLWRGREDYFLGANLTVYFSREQLKTRDYRGPDFFVVQGVTKHPRNSWVVWEEGGRYPDVIVELLSGSTEEIDKTIKFDIYAERFRTPEYFWYSPQTDEFQGFRLRLSEYEEILPNEQGWRWSEELQLYLGVFNHQLRYFYPDGQLVPTVQEVALLESQKAEQEAMRANQEAERAARLAAKLRELGINPDEV